MGSDEPRSRRFVDALPTRIADWRLLGRTLREVLLSPLYALIAVVTAFVALTLFVASQNYGIIRDFVVFGNLPPAERFWFMYDLYPLIGPNYSLEHGSMLVAVAALIGVNLSLTGYQIAELDLFAREGALGAIGTVLGTAGAGCAACGSAVLGGFLSAAGVTGALTVLPMNGEEFLLLAIVVMIPATYALARRIAGDAACPVDFG